MADDDRDMTRDEVEKTVHLLIQQGLEKLQWAADFLRGPLVSPSREAMRLEQALTRAVDGLRAAGLPHLPRG